jgi:hypothetical protein
MVTPGRKSRRRRGRQLDDATKRAVHFKRRHLCCLDTIAGIEVDAAISIFLVAPCLAFGKDPRPEKVTSDKVGSYDRAGFRKRSLSGPTPVYNQTNFRYVQFQSKSR